METRQVILQLRTAKGLSQEELAAKVYVTRQAVWSRQDLCANLFAGSGRPEVSRQ